MRGISSCRAARAPGIALYLAQRHEGVGPADGAARVLAMSATAKRHGGFGALRRERVMTVGQRATASVTSAALAGTFREDGHEAGVLADGEVTADDRAASPSPALPADRA